MNQEVHTGMFIFSFPDQPSSADSRCIVTNVEIRGTILYATKIAKYDNHNYGEVYKACPETRMIVNYGWKLEEYHGTIK